MSELSRFQTGFGLTLLTAALLVMAQTASASTLYWIEGIGILPGGDQSWAHGINASGTVAGTSRIGVVWAPADAVVYGAGGLVDLNISTGWPHNDNSALNINDAGQVVGIIANGGFGGFRAFLKTGSQVVEGADLVSGVFSSAYDINNEGQIVGFHTADIYSHDLAYFRSAGGSVTEIGTLGGDTSSANAVNDYSDVVGSAATASGATHAFFWTAAGGIQDLGTLPGGSQSAAYDFNNSGQVVGSADGHAVLWQSGVIQDLGMLPGTTSSVAYHINSAGQVVGSSWIPGSSGSGHAVIWIDGQIYDLNALISPDSGWVLGEAVGMNDAGQVVGNGVFNGVGEGFLLTPAGGEGAGVPEPGTVFLIPVGLGAVAWILRRSGSIFNAPREQ